MAGIGSLTTEPAAFTRAVASLRGAHVRPEVRLSEVPAPRKVAPYALAVNGEVAAVDDVDEAGGRFVLLHDPEPPGAWEGDLRVIALVKAVVEPELAQDPMLADVVWAWLGEALTAPQAPTRELGGTVTRVVSETFGTLYETPAAIQVELRASWTPDGPLEMHLQAWADVMCRLAGLPPLAHGVSVLPRWRG